MARHWPSLLTVTLWSERRFRPLARWLCVTAAAGVLHPKPLIWLGFFPWASAPVAGAHDFVSTRTGDRSIIAVPLSHWFDSVFSVSTGVGERSEPLARPEGPCKTRGGGSGRRLPWRNPAWRLTCGRRARRARRARGRAGMTQSGKHPAPSAGFRRVGAAAASHRCGQRPAWAARMGAAAA